MGTTPHPHLVAAAVAARPATLAAGEAAHAEAALVLGPFRADRVKLAHWVAGFDRLRRGGGIGRCSKDRGCSRGHTKEAEQECTSVHVFLPVHFHEAVFAAGI